MKLNELNLPLTYEQGKQYAIILSQEFVDRLEVIQSEHPTRHIAKPVPLTNGTFMLSGTILSEIGIGGLFASGFSYLDSSRFGEIDVIPWDDAIALLPVPEEEF